MYFSLYKKNKKIIDFSAYISLYTFAITDMDIVSETELPIGLQGISQLSNELKNILFEKWLMRRSISDERTDFDNYMINRHNVNYFGEMLGRMTGLEHTVSILSGFFTGLDDYYIMPQKNELLCYLYEDSRFNSLYLLRKYDDYNEFLSDFDTTYEYNKKSMLSYNEYTEEPFKKTITDNTNSVFPVFSYISDNKLTFMHKISSQNKEYLKNIPELYKKIYCNSDMENCIVSAELCKKDEIEFLKTSVLLSVISENPFINIEDYEWRDSILQSEKLCKKDILGKYMHIDTFNILTEWCDKYNYSKYVTTLFVSENGKSVLFL